ncbi:hypothetical protein [Paenibacillus humicus]|uniref:hypothetical protein n=1 Tax=Paenibacillus humicus TaxID=412861 RepID=UPI000FD997C1|nr:hypothetical protein [Paenibacillus humicus]
MPANTAPLNEAVGKNATYKTVPGQYYNPQTDAYEVTQGSGGAPNVQISGSLPIPSLVNLKTSDLLTGSLVIASGQYLETGWFNAAGRQVYNGQLSFQSAAAYNNTIITTAEYGDASALVDTVASASQYPQLADKSVKGANRLKWRVTNTAANTLTISQWGMTIR